MDAEAALGVYLEAMLAENRRLNLTSIRDPQKAHVLHVLDSLQIGELSLAPRRAIDLGSGNGFPGVALCALYPEAEVFLMERTGKKVAAMKRIFGSESVIHSGLRPPHLLQMDAAQAPALRKDLLGSFDLVTARALAPPGKTAALARPLLCEGGSLVLWLVDAATPPLELPGFLEPVLHRYTLPEPAARARSLVRYSLAPN